MGKRQLVEQDHFRLDKAAQQNREQTQQQLDERENRNWLAMKENERLKKEMEVFINKENTM